MADEERQPLASARDDDNHEQPPTYEGSGHHAVFATGYQPPYYPQGAPQVQPPAAFAQPQPHYYPGQAPLYPPAAGVVTMQPRLNEASQATLQAMHRSNPQGAQQLDAMIGNLGSNMDIRAAQDISRMASNWTYDRLLNGFLLPEEEINTVEDQQIQHAGVFIKDENGAVQQKLLKGRLVLTNKRLLFVSCGTNQESSLTPDARVGSYRYFVLSTVATDSVSFYPVPLQGIRSVMLSAEAVSKWSSRVKGFLAWTAMCCQGEEVSSWSCDQPSQTVQQHRIVRIGFVMPPFGKTVITDVYLEPSLSLSTVTEFVAKLQQHVPDFH